MSCERKLATDKLSPVKNALNGNFVLVKPKECQPPEQDSWTQRTDEMLLNTSAFGSDSDLDGYDTAPSEHSLADDVYEDCSTPTEHFLSNGCHQASSPTAAYNQPQKSENLTLNESRKVMTEQTPAQAAEVNPKPVLMPERTATDHFFFRNQWGKLKRFYSTLHWVQATADKNKETCFDCAAQISTRDVTTTEGTSIGDSANSLQEENCQFESSIKSAYTTPRSRGWVSANFTTAADAHWEVQSQDEESHWDRGRNSAMIETIDNLIIRLEQFMSHRHELASDLQNPEQRRQSMLNKPLGELSPRSKNEVHSMLREAADSMDVSGIDIDDSHSSIELVWSIVREAGRRFGFGKEDWPKKLLTEQSIKSRADDTIGSDESISASKANDILCSSISETKKLTTFSAFYAKDQTVATPTIALSRTSVKDETFKSDLSSSHTSSDLSQVKQLWVSKTESAPELKKVKAAASVSSVHFDQPGKFEHGDSRKISSYSKTSPPTRTIVRRRMCVAPKSEEYHTCRQVIQDTRGVKASLLPKRARKSHKKSTNQTRKAMPQVEEFKTSTKKGAHSYFEILNTRLVMPQQSDKRLLTESTIPIPLYSEAVWRNGELFITLKELDRDLAHLALNEKERFTRLPKSISIEFVREFKEDRLGQKSPGIIKKAMHDKTTSPTKEPQQVRKQPSPRPFNTKVDFIYKRDPLVLGTLDRHKFNRKVIEKQKLKKSRVPAFCVV